MTSTAKLKEPIFELSSHPDFRVVHVNAFFGGLNPIEGRITFYTDIIEPKLKDSEVAGDMELGKVQRERQIDLRFSPMDFINLANWMNSHIKRLEDSGLIKKEDIARTKQSNMPIV